MTQSTRPHHSLSRKKTAAFSAVAVLGALGCLEILLRLLGVGPVADRTRTWFPDHILNPPLLNEVVAETSGIASLTAGQAHHFHPVEPRRPENAFRVAVFGGSAAHGYGVVEPAAFPHRIEQLLQLALPNTHVQVVNLGTVAWSSQQILWAARQIWDYGPWDLLIVYSGHNELLELSSWKTYLAPSKHRRHTRALLWRQRLHSMRIFSVLDRRLNPEASAPEGRDPPTAQAPPGGEGTDGGDGSDGGDTNLEAGRDPVSMSPARRLDDLEAIPEENRARMGGLERRYGASTYRHNISRLIELAREHDVPVLLANPAPNDFHDPAWFKKKGTDGKRFDSLMAEARAAQDSGDSKKHEDLSRQALKLFDDPAAWFSLGNALLSQGRDAEAAAPLGQARETAEYPNRVLPSVSETILDFAGRPGVLDVVDVEAHFRSLDERGLIGYDLVYDHCHPSVSGSVEIAGLLTERLLASKHPRLKEAVRPDITAWVASNRHRVTIQKEPDPRIWEWDGRSYAEQPVRYISDFQGDWQAIREEQEDRVGTAEATATDWLWAGNGRLLDYEIDRAFSAWNQAATLDPTLCLAQANAAQALLWLGQRKAAGNRAKRALACEPDNPDFRAMDGLLTRLASATAGP